MAKRNIYSKSSTVRVYEVFKIMETTLVIIGHFVLFPCPFRRKQLLVFWEQDNEENICTIHMPVKFKKVHTLSLNILYQCYNFET